MYKGLSILISHLDNTGFIDYNFRKAFLKTAKKLCFDRKINAPVLILEE
jgi:hypothetical protein